MLKNILILLFTITSLFLYFLVSAQIDTSTNIDIQKDEININNTGEETQEYNVNNTLNENQNYIQDKPTIEDFINLGNPLENLSGVVKILGEVSRGDRIEFYIKGDLEGVDIYLGSAPIKDNKFVFDFDTNNLPNGKYKMLVKIVISATAVFSKTFNISINNAPLLPPQDLVKELEQTKNEVEKTEKEATIEDNEIKEIISSVEPKLVGNHEIIKKTKEVLEIEKEKLLLRKEKELKENEVKKIDRLIESAQKEIDIIEKAKPRLKDISKETLEKLAQEKKAKIQSIREIKENLEKELNIREDDIKTLEDIKEKQKNALKEKVREVTGSDEKAESLIETINKVEGKIHSTIEKTIEKKKVLIADDDGDGLPNEFEIRIGTSPKAADSDNDGILDSIEYTNGTNPLKPSQREKIVYKSPREVKVSPCDNFKVERVKIEKKEIQGKQENQLVISGKALPNSFVTVYIFSPIILLAKADENGNWEVKVDKEIGDGEHEVYVALTDNKGDVLARSEPLVFKKVQDDVVMIDTDLLVASFVIPVKKIEARYSTLTLIAIAIAVGVVLLIIGLRLQERNKSNKL
ncbi:hypothetical protein HRbin34_00494 [bacterium HR34]|nr:hypothetical protein HRbin34_00494 [bacterium HR34]